jgi:hypothetical protein
MTTEKIVARFMAKVDKDGPEVRPGLGPCWLWTGARLKKGARTTGGYGQFGLHGKIAYTHRVSYEMHVGKIPDGKQVMHSCDVRHCVNPKHLSLGTHADNMADMQAKNRGATGERCGSAKLTDAQVLEMRKDYAAGATQAALARKFSVTPANVHYIVKGRSRQGACAPRTA